MFLNIFFQIIVESEKEDNDDDEATVEDADESEEEEILTIVDLPEVKVDPQPAQPTRDTQGFETRGKSFQFTLALVSMFFF